MARRETVQALGRRRLHRCVRKARGVNEGRFSLMLKPVGLQIGLDDPFWKKIPFGQKHVVDVTVEGTQVRIGEWRLRERTKRCGVQLFSWERLG